LDIKAKLSSSQVTVKNRKNNMKVLIILLLFNFVFGLPDPVRFNQEINDAKPIDDYPDYKAVIDKLYPDKSNNRKGGRILNGIPARLGQFPHQALLNMYSSTSGWYICGGSFIKYNLVLTVKIYFNF
jgi:hypothetical protein